MDKGGFQSKRLAQICRIFLDGYGVLIVRTDIESYYGSSCLEALKKYDNVLPLTERQLVQYLQKVSRVLYNILIKDQWEKYKEAAVSYADLMSEIKGFHNAAYKVHRGTEDAFSTYEKLLVNFQAQYGKDADKS
ncbi:hypothetical protein Tco_0600318 [Tanacetum coccineum]|uniref:Uncharacterized protein n=1 Tax=Tanacetum coccineum TaxID=301880 RepID=A0ABQ4WBH5_9ASTR